MKTLLRSTAAAALVLATVMSAPPAHADVRARVNIGMVFDNRYHHDHYYPAPGYVAPVVPHGAVIVVLEPELPELGWPPTEGGPAAGGQG